MIDNLKQQIFYNILEPSLQSLFERFLKLVDVFNTQLIKSLYEIALFSNAKSQSTHYAITRTIHKSMWTSAMLIQKGGVFKHQSAILKLTALFLQSISEYSPNSIGVRSYCASMNRCFRKIFIFMLFLYAWFMTLHIL